jgi:uncharacterized protein (DUF2336 family)
VCSLAPVLIEVGEDHSLITKRPYVENQSTDERVEAERRFAERFAGQDANYLDPAMVEWDRKALALIGQQVKGPKH